MKPTNPKQIHRFIAIPELAALKRTLEPLKILPKGLRFDGLMKFPGLVLVQLTETDEAVASYGATFYVDAQGFTLEKAAQRREEKQVEFEAGLKMAA